MNLFSGFSNIPRIPELRNRILFSLMILVVYRFGVFVTIPGVDRTVMQALVGQQGGLVAMLNLFSGGALRNLSIFALGIMPYISASIIMQLMGLVSKQVEELRREGEQGRRKLEQWTRYGAIALRAGFQTGYDARGLTLGTGIARGIVRVDYAFAPTQYDLGSTHSISLSIQLN